MKILIIFDQSIDIKDLKRKIGLLKPSRVSLFSLTSQWGLVFNIENICQMTSKTEVNLEKSAELIDREVDILREKISKWSADFGEYKVDGKSIKDWFLLPNDKVSTWWFSLLSEKNHLKTNDFFNLARIQAIDRVISSGSFNLCILSVSEPSFSLATKMLCRRRSLKFLHIPSSLPKNNLFKEYIKSYRNQTNICASVLKALVNFIIIIVMSFRARLVMGSIKCKTRNSDNQILFVSFFPAVDKELAKRGILKNKYAVLLQDKLSCMGKKIIWIWLYVFLDGHSFSDALKIDKKIKNNGEETFFLYNFLSIKGLLNVLLLWVRQIRIFFKLKKLIPEDILYKGISIPEGKIFINNLMVKSFIGSTGLIGILHFEAYKTLFSYLSNLPYCIYFAEMQAWEKALCAAKELSAPQLKTVAFLHTSTPINFFPYFHYPSEMDSLPLPDILACNGDVSLGHMRDCGYPNIRKVEAIRHLYLNNYLDKPSPYIKDKVVLLCGSIDRIETKAMLSLFHETFPMPGGFQVWLKSHPCLSFEKIFQELKIDIASSGYLIKYDSIEVLLKSVKILIVGNSTVAIEALAIGCKVIIPVFSDAMFMSPLKGFEKYYTKVSNPVTLKSAIKELMESEVEENSRDIQNFISRYWCLDGSLKRWEEIFA